MKRLMRTELIDKGGEQRLKIGDSKIVMVKQSEIVLNHIYVWYEIEVSEIEKARYTNFEIVSTGAFVGKDDEHVTSVMMNDRYVRHIYKKARIHG